jgi:hypothetical protein
VPDIGVRGRELERWWREHGREQLAEILYWVWDPIGVNDVFPMTRGEYDNYVDQVFRCLDGPNAASEIEELLHKIERDSMGLGPAPIREERRPCVARLIAESWFEQSVGYWQSRGDGDWRHA